MGDQQVQHWHQVPVPGETQALALIPGREIIKATVDQAGCWVDGVRGIYATTAMIRIAVDYGWNITAEDMADVEAYDRDPSGDAGERVPDIADDAERWMTDHVAPEGYSFGWHDGSFYLDSEGGWCAASGDRCMCTAPHDDQGEPLR